MDLSQGGGRQRFGLEALEQLPERRAQLGFGQFADRFKILRRHFILQAGKLLGHLRRQDIQARGKELSDLDHHATHADRHGPETERQIT